MSKLEELIEQYCPDGVEYMKIGEVCKALPKGTLTTKELVEPNGHNYPVINSGRELYGYYTHFNNEGDAFTVAARGEYAGFITYFSGKFWAGGLCYPYRSYSPNISTKFIFYYLKTRQEYIRNTLVAEGSIPALNKGTLDLFEIPVPPLPVQEEIVRILDAFTELQAELQAELQKRKQQYNYYRDNLLTNFTTEQNVKEYTLGELGTFTRGNGLQKKDFTKEGIGCIHYGQIYTRFGAFADKTLTYVNRELASHLLQVEKGNLVIACTSENVEDICKSVAWLGEENICTGGHACVFRHNQNPKYISYFFQTEYFFNQKKKYTYGTKVKDIKPDSIAKIKIPLPSLKEQKRIVSILDNLYTLTTDLTQGLPAEIEKRRQQYEYYRDKLLTFKRKGA